MEIRRFSKSLLIFGALFLFACGGGSGGGSSSSDGNGAGNGDGGFWAFTSSTWSLSSDAAINRVCEISGSWSVSGSNPWTATNWVVQSVNCPGNAPPEGPFDSTSTITVSDDNKTLSMTSTGDGPTIDGATRVGEPAGDGSGSATYVGTWQVSSGSGSNGGPAGDPVMSTPYVNSSDMEPINEAYSATSSAPWGFAHDGIDFAPTGDLKPFQAVFPGTIESIRLWANDKTGNWQVNVRIIYNSTYSAEYAFEPMTTSQTDGQTQLSNILVSKGQSLAQGQVIGALFASGENAHVHFGFFRGGAVFCPGPYFTQEAKDSILALLRILFPGASMCY